MREFLVYAIGVLFFAALAWLALRYGARVFSIGAEAESSRALFGRWFARFVAVMLCLLSLFCLYGGAVSVFRSISSS